MKKYLIATLKKWPLFIICPLSMALWIFIPDYFSSEWSISFSQAISLFVELILVGFGVLTPTLLIVFFPIQYYLDQRIRKFNFSISLVVSILLGILITFIWLVKFKRFSFSLNLLLKFPKTFSPMFIVSIVFSILWSKLKEKQWLKDGQKSHNIQKIEDNEK